jgi:hypothetical protein
MYTYMENCTITTVEDLHHFCSVLAQKLYTRLRKLCKYNELAGSLVSIIIAGRFSQGSHVESSVAQFHAQIFFGPK